VDEERRVSMNIKELNKIFFTEYKWIEHDKAAFPCIAHKMMRQIFKNYLEETIFYNMLPMEERQVWIDSKIEKLFASSYRFHGKCFSIHW
jgi:hypothetical protein